MNAAATLTRLHARFNAHTEPGPDGCSLWTKPGGDGYGQFWDGQRVVRAHVWAWEQENGPVPDGSVVGHRCERLNCVNPAHLELKPAGDGLLKSAYWVERLRRAGEPLPDRLKRMSADEPDGCRRWTGAHHQKGGKGAGIIAVEGRRLLAHRVAYEVHHGAIPGGSEVLQTCGREDCINPGHLTLKPAYERFREGGIATRFRRGHAQMEDALCRRSDGPEEEGRALP